jgi:hypothetical protein
MPPNDLSLDPRNARKHGPKNHALVNQSLQETGPFRSIAIDGDGIIRAGNTVYEEATKLGLKIKVVQAAPDELIAVQRQDLTGDRAERAALWDNRTAETAEWDTQILDWLNQNKPQVVEGIWDAQSLISLISDNAIPIVDDGKFSVNTGWRNPHSSDRIVVGLGRFAAVIDAGLVLNAIDVIMEHFSHDPLEAMTSLCKYIIDTWGNGMGYDRPRGDGK